ncbi:MAG: hypothetical protein ACOYOF_21215 [Verrucomicrobiaceae bacterium]
MSSPWTADTRHLEIPWYSQEKEAVDQLIRLETRKRVEHLRAAMADVLGYLPSDEEMLDRGRSVMAVDARGYPCGVKCFLDMQEIYAPEWASFKVPKGSGRKIGEVKDVVAKQKFKSPPLDEPWRIKITREQLEKRKRRLLWNMPRGRRDRFRAALWSAKGGYDWLMPREALDQINDRDLTRMALK